MYVYAVYIMCVMCVVSVLCVYCVCVCVVCVLCVYIGCVCVCVCVCVSDLCCIVCSALASAIVVDLVPATPPRVDRKVGEFRHAEVTQRRLLHVRQGCERSTVTETYNQYKSYKRPSIATDQSQRSASAIVVDLVPALLPESMLYCIVVFWCVLCCVRVRARVLL